MDSLEKTFPLLGRPPVCRSYWESEYRVTHSPFVLSTLVWCWGSALSHIGDNTTKGERKNLFFTEMYVSFQLWLNISQMLGAAVKDFSPLLFFKCDIFLLFTISSWRRGRRASDKSLAPGQAKIPTAVLHKSVTWILWRVTANLKNSTVHQAQVWTPLSLSLSCYFFFNKSCCEAPRTWFVFTQLSALLVLLKLSLCW